MCGNFSTLEAALEDIRGIRKTLEDVAVESPRVYGAIKPMMEKLIAHLEFQARWIEGKETSRGVTTVESTTQHKPDQSEVDFEYFYTKNSDVYIARKDIAKAAYFKGLQNGRK